MRTLREKLSGPGRKIIDLEGTPNFIFNFDFKPEDETITLNWEDEGQDFEGEFPLDEPVPEIQVFLLTPVE